MAKFSRLHTLQAVLDTGLVPIFYNNDPEVALDVARAVARGGSQIVEFTNRGDGAPRVFERLIEGCRSELPDLVVGIGTINDPATAGLYLSMGVDFVVTPSLNPDVVRLCNRRKIPVLPGCGSGTEIATAEELGCEIIKVFPADALGGPSFIKAMRGPAPWSSLMPTGGVSYDADSVQSWIKAGAVAVGIGSALVSKEIVANKDFDALSERVATLLGWIQEARQ